MRIILLLMTVFDFDPIDMDCGSPPLPHSTTAVTMSNSTHFEERYEEYSVVHFECDSENSELVGDSSLRCLSGQWVGKAAKCGNYLSCLNDLFDY